LEFYFHIWQDLTTWFLQSWDSIGWFKTLNWTSKATWVTPKNRSKI